MMPDLRQSTTEYTAMSFLRASVSDVCNLNCIYCPKSSGMENYVPTSLRGQRLTIDAFCRTLETLAALGFQGLCITGGEPTTNPHLPEIMERSRPHFDVLELTSNGFKLSAMLPRISPLVDRVKISIDSANQSEAAYIGQSRRDPLAPALQSLLSCLDAGLTVTVNTVVMRRNLHELPALIEMLTKIADDYPRLLSHSLYDVYFTPTRRSMWEREFVQTSEIERLLTEALGNPDVSGGPDRRFLTYTSGRMPIVFKDTFGATPRAPACATCSEPCQEGVCSLRLSVEGWATACPSGSPALGTRIVPDAGATAELIEIARRVHDAEPEPGTFEKLVAYHGLRPSAALADRRRL